MEKVIINQKECTIIGKKGPCFLLGYSIWNENKKEYSPESLYQKVLDMMSNNLSEFHKDFVICAYRSNDWNSDFSPWEFSMQKNDAVFSGGGPETLAFLENDLIPFLKENFQDIKEFYTCGYSLSGLFSLWALYESSLLSGCVCCSGSLWYPGWNEYSQSRMPDGNTCIYLSLGKNEEKTRNKLMKTVGDNTRELDLMLKGHKHTFEWNPGGHFADSNERLAKGIKWILNQTF